MRRNHFIFLTFGVIVLTMISLYQYKVTKSDNFSSIAEVDAFQIKYSLKKQSRGEWMIDIEFFPKKQDIVIEESLITFAKPISSAIHSEGNDLLNHYLEGHVLKGTKLFSKGKMKRILKSSYIEIKWKTQDNLEKAERIEF